MTKVLVMKKSLRDRRIEENVDLVPPIARRIAGRLPPSFDVDDLISEGYLGLINAADTYDENSTMDFIGYAVFRVRFAILDSVRRRNYRANTMRSIETEPNDSDYQTSHHPADFHFRTHDRIEDLQAPRSNPEADLIRAMDEARHKSTLATVVEEIEPRTRRVLEIYYRDQRGIKDAGEELGVHASRASQIHHEGLRLVAAGLRRRGVVVEYAAIAAAVANKRAA